MSVHNSMLELAPAFALETALVTALESGLPLAFHHTNRTSDFHGFHYKNNAERDIFFR